MKVTIQIEREGKTPIEITREIAEVGKMQSITDIEQFLLSLSSTVLPTLGETMITLSQGDYVSEKKREA
jgi:hypothetical protein